MFSNSLSVFVRTFCALLLFALSAVVTYGASTNRFVIIDVLSSNFNLIGGPWTVQFGPDTTPEINPTMWGDRMYFTSGTGGTPDASAIWTFVNIAPTTGMYEFDAFILHHIGPPAVASQVVYSIQSTTWTMGGGCGTAWTYLPGFPVTVDHAAWIGNWAQIATAQLSPGSCYRVILNNANNLGNRITANAVRAERLFESAATIPDMPRVKSTVAAGTTLINSASNAAPTIVTTLTVTCPVLANTGQLMIVGSGESAAVSNIAGTNFNGVAYSISKDSTATDNTNLVQSSALATFNGDANRDFLHVERVDTCNAGQTVTYRLTAYRSQTATGPSSFIWNARLTAQYFPDTLTGL